MPNDARLGLVVGLGLVLTVAMVFFRKDLLTRRPSPEPAAAATVSPVKSTVPRASPRPARARTVSSTEKSEGERRERETAGQGVRD